MRFSDIYRLDESGGVGFHSLMPNIKIGLYNKGLVTVIDDPNVLKLWEREIGQNCHILCFTALGDVFYYDKDKTAVYFLSTQIAEFVFVDQEIQWFSNEFLTKDGVMDKILGLSRLEKALAYPKPQLKFGQCYIATPYECLGGTGDVDTFIPGAFNIYIDLVAQTLGV